MHLLRDNFAFLDTETTLQQNQSRYLLDLRNIFFKGFRIKNLSFVFAPFLIIGGVQLEAAADNEDVADDVADDGDDED